VRFAESPGVGKKGIGAKKPVLPTNLPVPTATNHMHQFLKFIYFDFSLYMFWKVFLSIIRSSRLYIQQ
jgi:hypothetical protein